MAAFLRVEPPEPQHSLYEDIFRLPGGHAMTVTAGSERVWPYWRLEETADIRFRSDDDYVDALRERYERTIRAHLRTIHPVGSHLSSGLDSGGVTAFAAKLLKEQNRGLRAFTAIPAEGWSATSSLHGRIADEGPLAARVAAMHSNVEHIRVHHPPEFAFEAYDRMANCFGMPVGAVLNLGWWDRINQVARAGGIRVMLLGVRGNVTLSRDGSEILVELLQEGRAADFLKEWQCARKSGLSQLGLIHMIAKSLLSPGVYRRLATAIGRGDSVLSLLRPEVRGGMKKRLGRREHLARLCQRGHDWTVGHTLGVWDIDSRDPTAARPMIEYCFAIPPEQFYFRGESRRLMRRLLMGVVPPEVLSAPGRGLQASDWQVAANNSWKQITTEIDRLPLCGALGRVLDYEHMLRLARKPLQEITREEFQSLLAGITADRFARGEGTQANTISNR
jgi:asparagine synthase (glutamine-hydrolysing)